MRSFRSIYPHNIAFIIKNQSDYDMTLADYLRDWNEMKTKLNNGSIRTSEYDHWRHSFPADMVKEQNISRDSRKG